MILQDGVLARLDDPRQVRMGQRTANRTRDRQRVDDITQGGELDDRDAGWARRHQEPPHPLGEPPPPLGELPNLSAMSRIRSRVAWLLGSPAMATRPPAARTVAPSGTDSAV